MENNWITENEVTVDSSSVAQFLQSLVYKSGMQFFDSAIPESPIETITFHTQGAVTKIFASSTESNKYVIYSNQYPDNIFESDDASTYKQIFGRFIELANPK